MNDYLMLNELFKNEQDSIGFQLFKKSNIIKLNNNNNGNYDTKQIQFNTLSISNKMINYSNAYIEIEVNVSIDFDNDDKDSVPNDISLKSSYEIVKSLRVMLNNTIIFNENDINRSSLINYALNNGKFYPISYRNMNKATGTLNNKFISKTKFASNNTEKHEISFKIPIYLRDISDFFRNIGIINFGEFNINLSLIDKITSVKTGKKGNTYKTKNAYLIVEEIQLNNGDNIKYIKMLNNGYEKKLILWKIMSKFTIIIMIMMKKLIELMKIIILIMFQNQIVYIYIYIYI